LDSVICEPADARALWAVRVLDAWADAHEHWEWRTHRFETASPEGSWTCWLGTWTSEHDYWGNSADAARLAAALAVFPSLPTDVRAKLGERP
jgi:hypothetical protein